MRSSDADAHLALCRLPHVGPVELELSDNQALMGKTIHVTRGDAFRAVVTVKAGAKWSDPRNGVAPEITASHCNMQRPHAEGAMAAGPSVASVLHSTSSRSLAWMRLSRGRRWQRWGRRSWRWGAG